MDLEIIAAETSERIRVTNIPFIQLNKNGYSYINSKAARMLGFEHGDVLRFFHSSDHLNWYIGNDPTKGAAIKKICGLHKFCDVTTIRRILETFDLQTARRVNFPLSTELVKTNGMTLLWIVPKPYNIEK